MPQKDIAGVVIVAFETEISVADWLVAKFSPIPIPTAASPAITHMTACRIEASLPRANQNHRNFRAGDRERGCELGHTSLLEKNAPAQGPKGAALLGPATPPRRSACCRLRTGPNAPRDGSVVSFLHCMNDPNRRVTWQATSDDENF